MMDSFVRQSKMRSFVANRLSLFEQVAKRSQKRCIAWGTIAMVAWIAGMTKLPPIQRARSVWPHIGMFVLASSIGATTKSRYARASRARQETSDQFNRLLNNMKPEYTGIAVDDYAKLEHRYPDYAAAADNLQYSQREYN